MQNIGVGETALPADGQTVHGKRIVGGEDEPRPVPGRGKPQGHPAEMVHVDDIEVSQRRPSGVPADSYFPAALAQAVRQYGFRRNRVLRPIIRRLVENAAHNANAHGPVLEKRSAC